MKTIRSINIVAWIAVGWPIISPQANTLQPYSFPEHYVSKIPRFHTKSMSNDVQNIENAVKFEADKVMYDEASQILKAKGHVKFTQNGEILKADQVIYNLQSNQITAQTNIEYQAKDGNVYFADNAIIDDQFNQGIINALKGVLIDESWIVAKSAEKKNETLYVFKKAKYTACKPCQKNPDKSPLWQLKANEVRYDQTENRYIYDDVTLNVADIPVAYLPYFSHPDGTIGQKSGVLAPGFSFGSRQGFGVTNSYYYAISPDFDATFSGTFFSQEVPLAGVELRKKFDDAVLEFDTSFTSSERVIRTEGDEDEVIGRSLRGHIFGTGEWHMNEKWRTGFDLQYASDDQYLRQYDINNQNILTSEGYIERFDQRNYISGRLLAFQDLRVNERSVDQPNIIPEVEASFIADSDTVFGGRPEANFSILGLTRDDEGQDVTRISTDVGWEREEISALGSRHLLSLNMYADGYSVDPNTNMGESDTLIRLAPGIHTVHELPFQKPVQNGYVMFNPKVSLTALTTFKDDDEDIPNEDSQEIQINPLNVFDNNRFPGRDRLEDDIRTAYGIETGFYGHDGTEALAFIGQSYQFNEDNTDFPNGSGLTERRSDWVGSVHYLSERTSFDYRFRFDTDNLASQNHEIEARTEIWRLGLDTTYTFAKAQENTDIAGSREQLLQGVTFDLSDKWRFRNLSRYDFGLDEGLRQAQFALDYFGQCVTLSGTVNRNFTRDSTGQNNTGIFFRIGLKNLGEFNGRQ